MEPDPPGRREDHPASLLTLTRIAGALGVDVGQIDPGPDGTRPGRAAGIGLPPGGRWPGRTWEAREQIGRRSVLAGENGTTTDVVPSPM